MPISLLDEGEIKKIYIFLKKQKTYGRQESVSRFAHTFLSLSLSLSLSFSTTYSFARPFQKQRTLLRLETQSAHTPPRVTCLLKSLLCWVFVVLTLVATTEKSKKQETHNTLLLCHPSGGLKHAFLLFPFTLRSSPLLPQLPIFLSTFAVASRGSSMFGIEEKKTHTRQIHPPPPLVSPLTVSTVWVTHTPVALVQNRQTCLLVSADLHHTTPLCARPPLKRVAQENTWSPRCVPAVGHTHTPYTQTTHSPYIFLHAPISYFLTVRLQRRAWKCLAPKNPYRTGAATSHIPLRLSRQVGIERIVTKS